MDSISKKAAVAAIAAFALASMLALQGCTGSKGETTVVANPERSITAAATAEVKAVPDKASLNLGITSRATEASDAQSGNAVAVDAVVAALASHGVAEKSIQTEHVNFYPSYDYSNGYGAIVGYEATTTLAVSDLAIDDVGTIVQAAVEAGATRVDGIRYYASTYDAAYDQALHQAIENAHAKAQSMAGAANARIGNVTSIVEGYQSTSARYAYANYDMAAEAAYGSTESMRVAPGELSIEASVTATYAID